MSVQLEIMVMKGVIRHVHLHGINIDQQPRIVGLTHVSVFEQFKLSFDVYEPCKCRGCCKWPAWRLLFLPQR